MVKEKIVINENGVRITPQNGNVWLSEWQIAKLFGVFPAKVRCNIKSIFKSEVLRINEVCYYYRYTNGGGVDLYNLEMITALAFRIKSKNSEIFRRWLIQRALSTPVFITSRLTDERKICPN